MPLFVASIIGGFTLGGILALIDLGFVLAFRATGTFNFAHGWLMLFPAYIVGYTQLHGRSLALGLPVALLTSAIIGCMFYTLVLRRTTGQAAFMGVIATFGLASILQGATAIAFKIDYNIKLPAVPDGRVTIFGATVGSTSLVVAAFATVLALGVTFVVRFTHLGLMVRASGQDAVLSSQCGINVRRVHMGSWAAAAVLAGIAGITFGSVATVSSSMAQLGLGAIPAIVLGGLDSIEGAVAGGVIVGLIQSFTQVYLGGEYVDLVTYSLLLIVLLFLPQGLFGTERVVRS